MQDKWHLKKKKGYLKIHIAVDVKTKEILSLEVTDEKVHDGRKIMSKLIEQILENSNNIKIKSALGDGSYDSNENFKYLQNKIIRPAIKVRKNSIISFKNNNNIIIKSALGDGSYDSNENFKYLKEKRINLLSK